MIYIKPEVIIFQKTEEAEQPFFIGGLAATFQQHPNKLRRKVCSEFNSIEK